MGMIDAERLGSEELAAELVRVRHEIDARELYFSQLAAAFAKTDHWEYDGANTAIRSASTAT